MNFQLQNISFSFGERKILDDDSFFLEPKNIYALMGANGSGKTTLFNLISGYLKPNAGKIILDKTNITKCQPFKINRIGISRTFQDLRLITKLTVKENIILAMRDNPTDNWVKALLPKYFYKPKIQELEVRADSIMSEYYLNDVKDSLAGEISYGQQKLLNLACCVANDASLVLLDEPVAGINPEYQKKMTLLLRQLKEKGKTVLLIEHNAEFINEVSDEIFFLREGKLTKYVTIEELRTDHNVMKAYL